MVISTRHRFRWVDRVPGEARYGAKERSEQLIASHLITEAQLEQASPSRRSRRRSPGARGLGVLEEQTLAEALSMYFGLAVLNLRRDTIEATRRPYP